MMPDDAADVVRRELLEACKAALPFVRDHVAMTSRDADFDPSDRIAFDKLEAAIRKAELFAEFDAQQAGTRPREYPQGRLGAHDEGSLVLMVGQTPQGLVKIDFGKEVVWFALPPAEAMALGASLIHLAREITGGPD